MARVLVDVPLAHLDRPFDYLVPAKLDDKVVAGLPGEGALRRPGRRRLRARAGRGASDHEGRLTPLRRAVSAEPVLPPEIARLSELVAARYAGTRSDVLRLAVPPRHAATEKEPTRRPVAAEPAAPTPARRATCWGRYPGGADAGRRARRRRGAAGGVDGAARRGLGGRAGARGGRRAGRGRGQRALRPGPPRPGPARRGADRRPGRRAGTCCSPPTSARRSATARSSRSSRGAVQVVAGTRAAAFAPGARPGAGRHLGRRRRPLRRAARAVPPHPRGAAAARPRRRVRRACSAAFARSVEASAAGARPAGRRTLGADRDDVRCARPDGQHHRGHRPGARARPRGPVGPAAEQRARRDPRGAGRTGRCWSRPRGAATPTALVCDTCREPARCPTCTGPLHLPRPHLPADAAAGAAPRRRTARCPACGGRGLRAPGARRPCAPRRSSAARSRA